MTEFGAYIIPVVVSAVILTAFFTKADIFGDFLHGAREGLHSAVDIAPALIGLITAISMLKASGALDVFAAFVSPLASFAGVPAEVIPLALLKPVSGSGSLALLNNILSHNSPDGFTGMLASVIAGSTETTFYTLTVYFGCVNIKNSKNTVIAALIADATAIIAAVLALNFL